MNNDQDLVLHDRDCKMAILSRTPGGKCMSSSEVVFDILASGTYGPWNGFLLLIHKCTGHVPHSWFNGPSYLDGAP